MNLQRRFLFSLLAVLSALTLVWESSDALPRQRVLIEHFTNASCAPCAANNPTLHAAMNAMTRDTVVKVSYHTWWPGSNDPFYVWNVSENTNRTNFYEINAVPDGRIDGQTELVFNQASIKASVRSRYATSSPCTINLVASTSGATGVYFSGMITAESTITGSRLYVALIEDVVTYASPPGTNGETVFPDPMRDMYPNAHIGEVITAGPGAPYSFSGMLNRSASWNPDNLSVVAWVQHGVTREIQQATWVRVSQFVVLSPNGGEVWTYPETHAITWNDGFAGGNVRIELNRDYPGGNWEELFAGTADDGTEDWTPTGPTSSTCRVRITSLADANITDISNANFTVQMPAIEIVTPNGGELLNGELPSPIQWSSSVLTGSVLIELNRSYPGGLWETIATVPNANTSQALGIPVTQSARLRITSVNEPFATDLSDGNFTIFVIDVAPEVTHDPHGDARPGDATFVAEMTDDRSVPEGTLYYREAGAVGFDAAPMTLTGNPREYAVTLPFAAGSFEYYVEATDSAGQTSATEMLIFDVGECGEAILYDDGTAEGYNWSNDVDCEWAILVEPAAYPFVLCGMEIAVAATRPGRTHSPYRARVLDTDGAAGLPGSEIWSEMTGSIGNVVGGAQPGEVHWNLAVIRDGAGVPLVLNEPFYLSVNNPINHKYEAFGRDDDTDLDISFYFDACDSQWHSEEDDRPSAQGGTRMIRPLGYSLAPPRNLVIVPAGSDVELSWIDSGAPYYRVFSAPNADGPFLDFIGSTPRTTMTDSNALLISDLRFYQVIGSATP